MRTETTPLPSCASRAARIARPLVVPLAAALFALSLAPACAAAAQSGAPAPDASGATGVSLDGSASALAPLVERYETDRRALRGFYEIDSAPDRIERLERFDREWSDRLAQRDFAALDTAGRIDWVLLEHELAHDAALAGRSRRRLAETDPFVPFAADVVALEEARWRLEPVDPEAAAARLDAIGKAVEEVRERVEAAPPPDEEGAAGEDEAVPPLLATPVVALRVAERVDDLRDALDAWAEHYRPFLPGFAWWTDEPLEAARDGLRAYAKELREEIAGQKGEDEDPLVGDPIGRDALLEDLAAEMIPYTPEELLAIGEAQMAWCETELARAADEMGLDGDWRAAVERVKGIHVPPGGQDALVAEQAREMIAFLEERELVTIPELCKETWRIRMLDAEGQRTLPFAAYGGQEVLVAYPTSDMGHGSKLMAMRGNNVHFTRSVTPHELIPGHHLQGFQAQRFATHRRAFRTPFLVEGWALYWELREWELGWPRGPEDRIGMLFWRMHRAARIVVSLRFHLGLATPAEMIDFLVGRVGHERDNATSEVRRYVGDGYSPLYQCAYLVGGLQLHALWEELVPTGRMSERDLHDAVLRQNAIPVEMIRAALTGAELAPGARASWRFAGEVTPVDSGGPPDLGR